MADENGQESVDDMLAEFDFDKKYETGEYDPIAKMIKPPPNNVGKRIFTHEWQQYISARSAAKKRARVQKTTARLSRSQAEIESELLELLVPRALGVLKSQLDSPDERVQQSAAVKVLEYARGKPVQKVQAEVAGVSKIIYESAAWQPQEANELAMQAIDILALPLPDDGEDDEPEA